MNNLTFLIITFLRDEYLFECLESIRQIYGNEPRIIVGDNGYTSRLKGLKISYYDAEYHRLPFDIGVSASRNFILEHIKTKYVCVGDDDFCYDNDAKVDVMLDFIDENTEADLVGGRIYERNEVRNYQGYLFIKDNKLYYDLLKDDTKITKCDLTFNYFVAKTETLKEIRWDDNIKVVYEHEDFFLSMKNANKTIYYHPEPIVLHRKYGRIRNFKEYEQYRYRKVDRQYFFNKHKIKSIVDFNRRNIDVKGEIININI